MTSNALSRQKVFENWVLKRIFGLKGRKGQEGMESCIMRIFIYL
jgi:hypothetical protein